MEAHLAPKSSVQVNKITSLCEICGVPHDTQYCMENPEQAFVVYASSRTNEAGGKWYMASQDARLSKFKADFKQQQGEMTNKIDTVLKAINDRITEHFLVTRQQESLKRPTANMSTKMEPSKSKEPAKALEYEFKDLHLNLLVFEVLAHAPMYNAILDKYVESLEKWISTKRPERPKQNDKTLSMEWKKDCAKSRPKSKNVKVRVNTEESAVKPEPELKNTVGCNLNPSDGPGKPNSMSMKTVKTLKAQS
ncbi:hypothetical protein Tco_0007869 [Tanacetum coccineum]